MGDKNNRGSTHTIKRAQAFAQKKFLAQKEKQLAEQKKAGCMIAAEAAMKKRALEFDFSTLRQHPVLTIEKTDDNVQMILNLDFFQSESVPGIGALLDVLTDYAAIISNVTILIKAPKHHFDISTYHSRAKNVMKLIRKLNTFNLIQLEVITLLDSRGSFEQLKLAAAAYGLKLYDWTLAYEIRGRKGKWEVQLGSTLERRLSGVYRREFLTQNY
ncbi:hypothetical protein DSL72_008550 [Monilinia vaccinii-corymbosi]|uniref:Uncharacterized protein n=1 Tax=Monilinia vaccinii-corymbosi TaxID=61207 RepID=A0A8A3PRE5_9HELO|nr:hypothetical protein DSL72_008550 [Monilinia vaccinii-corymbosi]